MISKQKMQKIDIQDALGDAITTILTIWIQGTHLKRVAFGQGKQ